MALSHFLAVCLTSITAFFLFPVYVNSDCILTKGENSSLSERHRLSSRLLHVDKTSLTSPKSTCNCSDAKLCKPLSGGSRQEVLVWYVAGDGNTWKQYNWSIVTTVAVLQDISQPVDQELLCFAHAHDVRVVWTYQAGCWDSMDECDWVGNASAREELIQTLLTKIGQEALDGVNLDIEGLTNNMEGMTSLTQELSQRVHAQCSGCTVSVDLSPIPMNVYGFTGYNWTGLSQTADYVITMNYDMNDFGPHGGFADANSPLPYVERIEKCVLDEKYDQHVPANRLVMGFPWYAYYVLCDQLSPSPGSCYSSLSFSKAASQHSLADAILNKLLHSHGGRQWDSTGQSPYFDVINGTHRYQVRYDDQESIKMKCLAAKSLGVRGVAFWTGSVEYGTQLPEEHYQLEKEMWSAVVWPERDSIEQDQD